jgi:hypothetical protein
MDNYVVKPLSADTWNAFARLVERHNGVFGGCWCTWFHTFHAEKTFTVEGNHALKEQLVKEDRAHAALVFDGDEAVAWALPPPQRQEELCDAQGRVLEAWTRPEWRKRTRAARSSAGPA